jgi:hypothetical protein
LLASKVVKFSLLANTSFANYFGGLAFKVKLGIKQEAIVNILYLINVLYYVENIYSSLFLVDTIGVNWYIN